MKAVFRSPVLRRFALSQFLIEVQFWFPVWLIFLIDRGFSMTIAVMADGVFRMTVVALELPLGILGDRIGRRRTYLGIAALTVLTFTAISQVESVAHLFAAWVVWGVLWALNSGTASAYLYELTTDHAVDVRAPQAFGVIRAVTSSAVLTSHLAAGWLYRFDERIPFLVTAAMGAVAVGVVLTLPEIRGSRRYGTTLRGVLNDMRQAWNGPTLRLAVNLSILLLIFGWSATMLFQPLILDLGLTPTAAGVSFFGYSAMAVVAGLWCGTVRDSRRRTMTTTGFVLLAAAMVGTAVLPDLGPFVFVPIMGFAYYLSWTLLDLTVSEESAASVRATMASGISLVGGIVIAVARPSLGVIADRASAAAAFGVWAAVGVVVTAVAIVLIRRLPARSGSAQFKYLSSALPERE